MNSISHVFQRSGLAALSDLQSVDWQDLFKLMEQDQSAFLAGEATFRSPGYRWPRDPLHTWSRVWEYPYAYYHLTTWRDTRSSKGLLRAADIGSGVTFFPFSVAKLGYEVTCVDVDAICAQDIARAAGCVAHRPGSVQFALCQGAAIPLEGGRCDAVFCISVLEHIAQPEKTVAEMARILRPSGLLILTIDIDLRGDGAIGVGARLDLMRVLQQYFSPLAPHATIHPADVLTSINAPYPIPRTSLSDLPYALWRNRKLGRRDGLKWPLLAPNCLAVEGGTWLRKEAA